MVPPHPAWRARWVLVGILISLGACASDADPAPIDDVERVCRARCARELSCGQRSGPATECTAACQARGCTITTGEANDCIAALERASCGSIGGLATCRGCGEAQDDASGPDAGMEPRPDGGARDASSDAGDRSDAGDGSDAGNRTDGGTDGGAPSDGGSEPLDRGVGAPDVGFIAEVGVPLDLGVPDAGLGLPDFGVSLPDLGLGWPDLGLGWPDLGGGGRDFGVNLPDLGLGLPDVGANACGDLDVCCQSLPAVFQATCQQVVAVGDPLLCATALQTFQQQGLCP